MSRNQKIILMALVVAVIASIIALFLLNRKEAELPSVITPANVESPFVGKPLPPDKETIKRELVANLGEGGTITETPEFNIYYFAPDIFQVEIKTANIVEARDKAIAWFKNKGFSEEDICKLPVTFYLNAEVARKLEGSGVIVNTLPDFCQ